MAPQVPGFADGRFHTATFLRDFWQRKPCLIRNPWHAWVNPLDPDDLAGLACDEGVESRLITSDADQWVLEHGPLAEDRFGNLAPLPWTLLVQAVDHHVPAVADLLEPFRFVPNWRIDDVMVSYAVDGGGVGAHFDQYDVFLVQGLGRRRWQLGGLCDDDSTLLPHDGLRLLADFEPVEDWVLEPGDMIYVPPRFAHKGVAVGDDCMTYSIGFRAPSRGELLAGWTENRLDTLGDDDRYRDRSPAPQSNPGEISADALASLHAMVTGAVADRAAFARWFGEYATVPKSAELDWRPETPITAHAVRRELDGGSAIVRNPASRFAFVREGDAALALFVDGELYECRDEAARFAEMLCAQPRILWGAEPAATDAIRALIEALFNRGCVAFEAP